MAQSNTKIIIQAETQQRGINMLWDKDSYQADGYKIFNIETSKSACNIHGKPYSVYSYKSDSVENAVSFFESALKGVCDMKSIYKPEGVEAKAEDVYIDWRIKPEVRCEEGQFNLIAYFLVMSSFEYFFGFEYEDANIRGFKEKKHSCYPWSLA